MAVATKPSGLDSNFIEKQRQQLRSLRASLLSLAQAGEADEANIRSDSSGTPLEYEDDAQKLASLELDGNLVVRDVGRLERVDRALKKIEDGTYGVSDVSGLPIPRDRLEAVPEAICTLLEESALEQKRPR
ncbi:MAG: TraR/DksA family transcriptional regulator [Gammaproteobacteria bacterium]